MASFPLCEKQRDDEQYKEKKILVDHTRLLSRFKNAIPLDRCRVRSALGPWHTDRRQEHSTKRPLLNICSHYTDQDTDTGDSKSRRGEVVSR
jgi:hypothetical protein